MTARVAAPAPTVVGDESYGSGCAGAVSTATTTTTSAKKPRTATNASSTSKKRTHR